MSAAPEGTGVTPANETGGTSGTDGTKGIDGTGGTAGADEAGADEAGALVSRLRVIEDQPLELRAAAFVQIHDRLQNTLEGSGRDGNRDGGFGPSNSHD